MKLNVKWDGGEKNGQALTQSEKEKIASEMPLLDLIPTVKKLKKEKELNNTPNLNL